MDCKKRAMQLGFVARSEEGMEVRGSAINLGKGGAKGGVWP